MEDKVRVVRVLIYEGDRRAVEETLSRSIHGKVHRVVPGGRMTIFAADLQDFPLVIPRDSSTDTQGKHNSDSDDTLPRLWRDNV